MKYQFIPYEFPVSRDGKFILCQQDNDILRTRREQLGLTQQQVADMAGVPFSLYQRLESGSNFLSGCSMKAGLAICAVLMLDPYEGVPTFVEQLPRECLRPLVPFDAGISLTDHGKPKKAGRKKIRRDIMAMYFNSTHYSVMIPSDVLIALGKPAFIQILTDADKRRVIIRPVSSAIEDSFDVPDHLYDGYVLAFPGPELISGTKEALEWEDDCLYSAECRLVRDEYGKMVALSDLNTAKPSEQIDCPLVIPECLDEEDEFEEDDEEENSVFS